MCVVHGPPPTPPHTPIPDPTPSTHTPPHPTPPAHSAPRPPSAPQVLNAKPENVERESEIIAQSGRRGAVTISTNMAGRGTDILLGGNPDYMARWVCVWGGGA